ncbi:hypothetical protein PCANC_09956 [Puccinia coronata f. sp. avenae]|uniref:CUE domain-containing protein n=1 Tax=Puccinia coronata f. sp. avenae TaxID=200324 RepID=A0A2N5V2T3_9BASI|nr:hypothetical protein PCANC_09956 [Puccinia coronata f. sp. avenae]
MSPNEPTQESNEVEKEHEQEPKEGEQRSETIPKDSAHSQLEKGDRLTSDGLNVDGEPLAKEKESNQEQKKPEEGVKEREKLEEMAEEPPLKSQHDQRPAQNQTQNQATSENQPVNQHSPQVQELLAIFPQIQPSILEDVLAAHRNEVSACISDLLAISDPTYKPSEQESMAQLDAELARQLSLQETQQQHAAQPSPNDRQQISNLPYQPRIKRNTPTSRSFVRQAPPSQPQQDQAGGANDGKDEIQKIAEEIGKLAETGKKTMSLWLEKAKAKIQEIQLPTSPVSQSESLEGNYEHVARPSSSSIPASPNATNPPNTSATSTTTKSTRITPALPHSSRYSNTNRTPTSTHPSTRSLGGPPSSTQLYPSSEKSKVMTEGYHVEETSSTAKDAQKLGSTTVAHPSLEKIPSAASSATLPLNHHQHSTKVREDDEESLEYTRNPFEDDD